MATRQEDYMEPLSTEQGRKSWIGLVIMGITFLILGVVALGTSMAVSYVTVSVLGFVLLASGLFLAIHSFSTRQVSGFFLNFFGGILMMVMGVLLFTNPTISLISLTLLMVVYFITMGVVRTIQAAVVRYENWGWGLLGGLVTLLLGLAIWAQWPQSSLFVIGMFIGIDLLLLGMSSIMLGIGIHRVDRLIEQRMEQRLDRPGPNI